MELSIFSPVKGGSDDPGKELALNKGKPNSIRTPRERAVIISPGNWQLSIPRLEISNLARELEQTEHTAFINPNIAFIPPSLN